MKGGGDTDGPTELFKPFKFVITMENRKNPGYFTEKALNGILADSIPIYWGAPDVDKIVNVKRMVVCDPSEDLLDTLRSKPRVTNDDEFEARVEEGVAMFRDALKPCIDEIIRLDQDDNAYAAKLEEPVLLDNRLEGSYFDYHRYARDIANVMKWSRVPNVRLKESNYNRSSRP